VEEEVGKRVPAYLKYAKDFFCTKCMERDGTIALFGSCGSSDHMFAVVPLMDPPLQRMETGNNEVVANNDEEDGEDEVPVEGNENAGNRENEAAGPDRFPFLHPAYLIREILLNISMFVASLLEIGMNFYMNMADWAHEVTGMRLPTLGPVEVDGVFVVDHHGHRHPINQHPILQVLYTTTVLPWRFCHLLIFLIILPLAILCNILFRILHTDLEKLFTILAVNLAFLGVLGIAVIVFYDPQESVHCLKQVHSLFRTILPNGTFQ